MCRNEGVQAYPTLILCVFRLPLRLPVRSEQEDKCRQYADEVLTTVCVISYNKGASVEYHGQRTVEAMKEFALKAMAACVSLLLLFVCRILTRCPDLSTTVTAVESEVDLKRSIADEPVVILFLHSPSTSTDSTSLAHSAAKSLLGAQATYLSSSSPEIFDLFSIAPSAPPTFLTFKDHSPTPYSSFVLPSIDAGSPKHRLALTKQYLRTAKLPIVSELNGATYTDMMPPSSDLVGSTPPPLVGLVVLSRKGLGDAPDFEIAKSAFEQVAKGWVERRRMNGKSGEGVEDGENKRDVVWAWVDGDKWKGWARSMFDVKDGAKDGPKVVIVDPKVRCGPFSFPPSSPFSSYGRVSCLR